MVRGYTTIEQSKKLLSLGLDPSTADMFYQGVKNITTGKYCVQPNLICVGKGWEDRFPKESVGSLFQPAWSLTALLRVLPKIGAEEPMVKKLYYANEPKERYICEYGLTNITNEYDNPVDACIDMIEKLHKLNQL